MSKEYLEAFDRIEQEVDGCMDIYHTEENDIDIVKQALQRLEAIDNANPSKALECWNWLNATIPQWCREKDKDNQDTLIPIKQALVKSQDQEKETRKGKEKMNSAVAIVLICSFMVVAVMEIIFNRRK